jgi:hypothetical protein
MTLVISRAAAFSRLEDLVQRRATQWSEAHPASILAQTVQRGLGEEEWSQQRADLASLHEHSLEFASLDRFGKICVPLGEPEVYFALASHNTLRPEYYYEFYNVFTREAVDRKIDDMRSCAYAILPGLVLGSRPQMAPLDRKFYSRLLMFPIAGQPDIPPPPTLEFADFARTWFVPVRKVAPELFLCIRQPGTLPR